MELLFSDNPPKASETISKPHSLTTVTQFIPNVDNDDNTQDDDDIIEQIPRHEYATRANTQKKLLKTFQVTTIGY